MDRLTEGRVFASIDMGSHTLRLLIVRCREDKVVEPVRSERRVTRLARGFEPAGTLQPRSMERSLVVLEEYARMCREAGAARVVSAATGVLRRAENAAEFLDAAFRATGGWRPRILSETEEALLSAKGMMSVVNPRVGCFLCFDLGGSSTEFVLLDSASQRVLWTESFFIGAATLTERFFRTAPALPGSLEAAADYARAFLAPARAAVHRSLEGLAAQPGPPKLVGTAGTVTTLGAIFLGLERYRPSAINNLMLHEDWIRRTILDLAALDCEGRRRIRGLETGREDIILGGALIVQEILRLFSSDTLVAVDAGLLEGLVLSGIEEERGIRSPLVSPLTWYRKRE